MSSPEDDTTLPSRRPVNSGGLDGDTVLPYRNATGIHEPGDVIDNRYTVLREIGRGGMGVVYEVEDEITGDRYAIKRLLPEFASRPEIIQQFRNEGAASMRFTHQSRHFVTTQTIGLCGGLPYIVMQLIKHPTLRTLMVEHSGVKSTDEALPIVNAIAMCLAELHSLGYVHRDLKPENIFVDRTSSPLIVQLVDFGLTKDEMRPTATMMKGAGTERYASPEQKKGLPTTASTDVYAFGVISYELICGELPSYGDKMSDFVENVPDQLEKLIDECLASKWERRPTDGSALFKSLQSQISVDEMVIRDDSKAVRQNALEPRDTPVHTCILNVVGAPEGAKIFLDDREVSGTRHEIKLTKTLGNARLTVTCDGYSRHSRNVLLVASTTVEESVQLTLIPAKAQLSSINPEPLRPSTRTQNSTRRLAEFPNLTQYIEDLRSVPGGVFAMGSSSGRKNELPVHKVRLSSFRMGATPVPFSIWKEYCAATGLHLPKSPTWGWLDDHPVVNVSWHDIMGADGSGGFCRWVSEVAGFTVTLPTEAQFEYAARDGGKDKSYPWGTTFSRGMLWCSTTSGDAKRTAPVVRTNNKFANRFGLTDMAGNVWQWCFDWSGDYSTSKFAKSSNFRIGNGITTDPIGPPFGKHKCVRGGGWGYVDPFWFRCANRDSAIPSLKYANGGFRLVANAK